VLDRGVMADAIAQGNRADDVAGRERQRATGRGLGLRCGRWPWLSAWPTAHPAGRPTAGRWWWARGGGAPRVVIDGAVAGGEDGTTKHTEGTKNRGHRGLMNLIESTVPQDFTSRYYSFGRGEGNRTGRGGGKCELGML